MILLCTFTLTFTLTVTPILLTPFTPRSPHSRSHSRLVIVQQRQTEELDENAMGR